MIKKKFHTDFLEIEISRSDYLSEDIYDLLENNINSLSTQNVAFNLNSVLNLTKADFERFDRFKSIFDQYGTFFVVISKELDVTEFLQYETAVVPTVNEAGQYIRMEEMQKQLDL